MTESRRYAPDYWAERTPTSPAVLMDDGRILTYRQLTDGSRRFAHALQSLTAGTGASVAILLENCPEYLVACFGAIRSGRRYTPVSIHLGVEEAIHIVGDCGASILVTSPQFASVARKIAARTRVSSLVCVGDAPTDMQQWDAVLMASPPKPLSDEREGMIMPYSSGTTGRPKGVVRPLPEVPYGREIGPHLVGGASFNDLGPDDVFLTPAPLYHSAPNAYSVSVARQGVTNVCMRRFDPVRALELIQQHGVTHAQFVPTMFVRMLQLDDDVRRSFDVSSLRRVLHGAAPCPVEVKRRMMDWWGPILYEYYSGSEGIGGTRIGPREWMDHPGSVGRPDEGYAVHVLDENGEELPVGETGQVWFEGGPSSFRYHGNPGKTRAATNDRGWRTLGDVGYMDADGYLYLRDRLPHLILTGGVNVYPQEVEDLLVTHPGVVDAAVVGVPNEEFGQEVKAVVVLRPAMAGRNHVESELVAFCRDHLAHYKCPRSVEVVDSLPRTPTGKLLKHQLQERYWRSTSA